MERTLDKADLAAIRILSRLGPLYRTSLVKLLYLVDLHARWWNSRPVTNLDYWFWDHGPFDRDFFKHEEHLEGIVDIHVVDLPEARGFKYHLKSPTAPEALMAVDDADERIIEFVCDRFGDLAKLSAKGVAELTYKTPPMEKALKNDGRFKRLDMDAENGRLSRAYGVSLDQFLSGLADVRAGKFIDVEDLAREFPKG